jgi:hypothetical protein
VDKLIGNDSINLRSRALLGHQEFIPDRSFQPSLILEEGPW